MNNSIPVVYRAPNPLNLFRFQNIPLVFYFIAFRLASQYVKTHFWLSFKGFKRYRLQNLTICWSHAMIVGIADLFFMLTHKKEACNDITHYYSFLSAQIPLISVGYFIQDALDMLSYEWSKYSFELFLHHIATCCALIVPGLTDKFIIASGWALLMEVNSIFLHARTILQICGLCEKFPKIFKSVIYTNLVTFVIFRIISQLYWVKLAIFELPKYHWFYQLIGLGGPVLFGVINGLLFLRLLASDGFLSQSLRDKYAMTRDKNDDDKKST